MSAAEPQFLNVGDGASRRRIAYRAEHPPHDGASGRLGLLWLAGFKSDMASTKATALAAWAHEMGLACTRFDYSGHGQSDGRFEDGTIGAWLDEAYAVCTRVALSSAAEPPGAARAPAASRSAHGDGDVGTAPQILVGSSMGAYIALLLLRRLLADGSGRSGLIRGLVLIAPAWDMTEELIWKSMTEADRRRLLTDGVFPLPSPYGEPTPITRALIEDGRSHLLSEHPFDPGCPVRVLQGLCDEDVPPAHARKLASLLEGGDVEIVEVPDGDHRLSRPEDIARLFDVIARLAHI